MTSMTFNINAREFAPSFATPVAAPAPSFHCFNFPATKSASSSSSSNSNNLLSPFLESSLKRPLRSSELQPETLRLCQMLEDRLASHSSSSSLSKAPSGIVVSREDWLSKIPPLVVSGSESEENKNENKNDEESFDFLKTLNSLPGFVVPLPAGDPQVSLQGEWTTLLPQFINFSSNVGTQFIAFGFFICRKLPFLFAIFSPPSSSSAAKSNTHHKHQPVPPGFFVTQQQHDYNMKMALSSNTGGSNSLGPNLLNSRTVYFPEGIMSHVIFSSNTKNIPRSVCVVVTSSNQKKSLNNNNSDINDNNSQEKKEITSIDKLFTSVVEESKSKKDKIATTFHNLSINATVDDIATTLFDIPIMGENSKDDLADEDVFDSTQNKNINNGGNSSGGVSVENINNSNNDESQQSYLVSMKLPFVNNNNNSASSTHPVNAKAPPVIIEIVIPSSEFDQFNEQAHDIVISGTEDEETTAAAAAAAGDATTSSNANNSDNNKSSSRRMIMNAPNAQLIHESVRHLFTVLENAACFPTIVFDIRGNSNQQKEQQSSSSSILSSARYPLLFPDPPVSSTSSSSVTKNNNNIFNHKNITFGIKELVQQFTTTINASSQQSYLPLPFIRPHSITFSTTTSPSVTTGTGASSVNTSNAQHNLSSSTSNNNNNSDTNINDITGSSSNNKSGTNFQLQHPSSSNPNSSSDFWFPIESMQELILLWRKIRRCAKTSIFISKSSSPPISPLLKVVPPPTTLVDASATATSTGEEEKSSEPLLTAPFLEQQQEKEKATTNSFETQISNDTAVSTTTHATNTVLKSTSPPFLLSSNCILPSLPSKIRVSASTFSDCVATFGNTPNRYLARRLPTGPRAFLIVFGDRFYLSDPSLRCVSVLPLNVWSPTSSSRPPVTGLCLLEVTVNATIRRELMKIVVSDVLIWNGEAVCTQLSFPDRFHLLHGYIEEDERNSTPSLDNVVIVRCSFAPITNALPTFVLAPDPGRQCTVDYDNRGICIFPVDPVLSPRFTTPPSFIWIPPESVGVVFATELISSTSSNNNENNNDNEHTKTINLMSTTLVKNKQQHGNNNNNNNKTKNECNLISFHGEYATFVDDDLPDSYSSGDCVIALLRRDEDSDDGSHWWEIVRALKPIDIYDVSHSPLSLFGAYLRHGVSGFVDDDADADGLEHEDEEHEKENENDENKKQNQSSSCSSSTIIASALTPSFDASILVSDPYVSLNELAFVLEAPMYSCSQCGIIDDSGSCRHYVTEEDDDEDNNSNNNTTNANNNEIKNTSDDFVENETTTTTSGEKKNDNKKKNSDYNVPKTGLFLCSKCWSRKHRRGTCQSCLTELCDGERDESGRFFCHDCWNNFTTNCQPLVPPPPPSNNNYNTNSNQKNKRGNKHNQPISQQQQQNASLSPASPTEWLPVLLCKNLPPSVINFTEHDELNTNMGDSNNEPNVNNNNNIDDEYVMKMKSGSPFSSLSSAVSSTTSHTNTEVTASSQHNVHSIFTTHSQPAILEACFEILKTKQNFDIATLAPCTVICELFTGSKSTGSFWAKLNGGNVSSSTSAIVASSASASSSSSNSNNRQVLLYVGCDPDTTNAQQAAQELTTSSFMREHQLRYEVVADDGTDKDFWSLRIASKLHSNVSAVFCNKPVAIQHALSRRYETWIKQQNQKQQQQKIEQEEKKLLAKSQSPYFTRTTTTSNKQQEEEEQQPKLSNKSIVSILLNEFFASVSDVVTPNGVLCTCFVDPFSSNNKNNNTNNNGGGIDEELIGLKWILDSETETETEQQQQEEENPSSSSSHQFVIQPNREVVPDKVADLFDIGRCLHIARDELIEAATNNGFNLVSKNTFFDMLVGCMQGNVTVQSPKSTNANTTAAASNTPPTTTTTKKPKQPKTSLLFPSFELEATSYELLKAVSVFTFCRKSREVPIPPSPVVAAASSAPSTSVSNSNENKGNNNNETNTKIKILDRKTSSSASGNNTATTTPSKSLPVPKSASHSKHQHHSHNNSNINRSNSDSSDLVAIPRSASNSTNPSPTSTPAPAENKYVPPSKRKDHPHASSSNSPIAPPAPSSHNATPSSKRSDKQQHSSSTSTPHSHSKGGRGGEHKSHSKK